VRNDSIHLSEYDERWPIAYEEARARLAEALHPYALDIQHVGSTSVPGLAAKPIIDIALAIEEYPLPAAAILEVVALGYEFLGEHGIPRRHYFRKGRPRTHHVHVVEGDSQEWEHFILFRDYLRTHPQAARRYEALKRELAARYQDDRAAYTDSKAPFIKELMEEGRAWRQTAVEHS